MELNSRTFLDCLHSNFAVSDAEATDITLELTQVNDAVSSPRLQNFSLVFRGPMSPLLPQRIYRLSHSKLGPLDIFLVPIGPDQAGMQYEAVFNLLRDGVQ